MVPSPHKIDDPLYDLLQQEKIMEFNSRRVLGDDCDLTGARLRGLDLRGLDAENLNLQDAYLRGADLRGIDFRTANLEGASLADANISGCYFPPSIPAEEIRLSVVHGTRIRMGSSQDDAHPQAKTQEAAEE